MSGFVYFIYSDKCPHDSDEFFKNGFVKIGMTGDVDTRFKAINKQCDNKAFLQGYKTFETWIAAREWEQEKHKKFKMIRFRGEWFYRTPLLKRWIRKNIEFKPRRAEARNHGYNFGGIYSFDIERVTNIPLYDEDDGEIEYPPDDRYERSALKQQGFDMFEIAYELRRDESFWY